MSQQESVTAVFSAPSPSDINIQHPNKRTKISYTREFLLSLSKADAAVRLPMEVKISFPCIFKDAPGLLSPPFCARDSGCHKSVPQNSSMNILNNANHLLHRSNEPYRPPCRLKAPPPSSRDGDGLLKNDTCGSSQSKNQEKSVGERGSKGMVTLPNEDIWYSSNNTDSQEYSEASVSPPVEDEKQLTLMVEKCESAPAHCERIDVKHSISVTMKLNPTSPGVQIQHELELNSCSNSLDRKSRSSFELCLPDEDSLISFDEQYFIPELENSAVVDNSKSSPERNPIEVDSPSSPRDIVEKLVESILNDESCPPAPHLDYPIVHSGAGLEGYCHPLHAQQSYTQFCSNQLNLGRDEKAHNSFPRSTIDSATCSFVTLHSFSPNTTRQPFPLSHEELRRVHDQLRRFDHGVSQPMLQQTINPGKLHLCALCVSQSGVTPHLPLQMAPSTHSLNTMQNCTLGYQEPRYGALMGPTADYTDGNINQAELDSLVDMNLRARHWHPYVGGF